MVLVLRADVDDVEGLRGVSAASIGQTHDPTTGLMYYRARYYDPAIGRFISADTIVPNPTNPQDLNRYTYVRNNPINYTDPAGHCSEFKVSPNGEWSCSFASGSVVETGLFQVEHPIDKFIRFVGAADAEFGEENYSWYHFAFGDATQTDFYRAHREGGRYDSKHEFLATYGEYADIGFGGHVYFDVWGNAAFGYTGVQAGLGQGTLHEAARRAASNDAGISDLGDVESIELGFALHEATGGDPERLTAALVVEVLASRMDEFEEAYNNAINRGNPEPLRVFVDQAEFQEAYERVGRWLSGDW